MKMTILVVGASGATGSQLVKQLLNQGHHVKAIVRSVEKLPKFMMSNERVTIICTSLLDLSATELKQHVKGWKSVV